MATATTDIQEDAVRKYEEERKQKEEQRRLYNEEVVKTKELLNLADDYETACKIRAMVLAAERKEIVDAEWIAWAKAKADWFDPTVAAKDTYFVRRNHKNHAKKGIVGENDKISI